MLGVPIPPPHDDLANWPFRKCTYEQARGWRSRILANPSGEHKAIAAEFGVSRSTITRAVRWVCISIGDYNPVEYGKNKRRWKAEGRRWWRAKMDARDEEIKRVNAELRQARETIGERRRAQEKAETGTLHIAISHSDDSERRARNARLQRAINERNRRQWGS
jgi:hypothetical protein